MCPYRFLLIFVFVLQSCGSAKDSKLQEFISKKLGKSTLEYNTSKEFVLCYENEGNASEVYKYLIIRIRDQLIVEEGTFRPGYIKWINDDEIEIRSIPGTFKSDDDLKKYTRIISVRKK